MTDNVPNYVYRSYCYVGAFCIGVLYTGAVIWSLSFITDNVEWSFREILFLVNKQLF